MRHGADTLMDDYECNVFRPDENEDIKTTRPNYCEYEREWQTKCFCQTNTSRENVVVHRSYSCSLCWCKYPNKECGVKKQ